MSNSANTPIIMVMTARGPDRIVSEKGTQSWHLNPDNAKRYEYVVCVQNRHNGNWGGATEPHLMAFLIGKISDVELSKEPIEPGKPPRYIIKISEYARLKKQAPAWVGRNPVAYTDLAYLGIQSLDDSVWHVIPQSDGNEPVDEDAVVEEDDDVEASLELEEGIVPSFRRQIAAAMGVLPSKVQINIDLMP